MPKKTKRQHRKAPITREAPAPVSAAQPESAAAVSKPAVSARAATASKVDLAQEYHYVFADLRKIAIIAVVMFVLLFALAYVLR